MSQMAQFKINLIPIGFNVSAPNCHYHILFFRNTSVNTLLWGIQTVPAMKGVNYVEMWQGSILFIAFRFPNILTFIVINSWMQFSGQAFHSEASTTKTKRSHYQKEYKNSIICKNHNSLLLYGYGLCCWITLHFLKIGTRLQVWPYFRDCLLFGTF